MYFLKVKITFFIVHLHCPLITTFCGATIHFVVGGAMGGIYRTPSLEAGYEPDINILAVTGPTTALGR